jgi:hypothetical protein
MTKQYAPKVIYWPDAVEVVIPGLKLHSLNWMLAGISEGSRRMRHAAAKHQRAVTTLVLRSELGGPAGTSCRVTITRLSPGTLDDDALPASAKHVRDGVADWLGVDDRDPHVEWRYAQQTAPPRSCGVSIRIQWLRNTAPRTLPGVA